MRETRVFTRGVAIRGTLRRINGAYLEQDSKFGGNRTAVSTHSRGNMSVYK